MNLFRSALTVFIFLTALWIICTPVKSEAAEDEYDPVLFPENYQPGFLGNELIPKNSQNSGAASTDIAIMIPPGRGRIHLKDMALNYNSGSKNGFVGVGWSLELGAIQRDTRRGVDYGGDAFIVVKNGSKELVVRPEWGSSYYGAKIEEDFTKYNFSTANGWTALLKDGTRYYYGQTSASRQQNAKGVFKWCLDQVVDSNGNTMTITYIKDQGQIYPDSVSYAANSVSFVWEDRSDFSPDYVSQSPVITAKRLKSIHVYANGALARSYTLSYEYGASTGFSRLIRIDQPLLPPITIDWNEGGSGDFAATAIETPVTQGSTNAGYAHFADVSGDGRADLIMHSATGYFFVYLSSGDGYFSDPVETFTTQGSNNVGYVDFADLNNDGRTDLIKHTATGFFYVYFSSGDGHFKDPVETPTTKGSNDVGYVNFVDLNGDGLGDLVKHSASGFFYAYLSDGSGIFTAPVETRTIKGSNDNGFVHFADVNGDGRSDLIKHSAYGYFYIYLSSDDGSFTDPVETRTTEGSSDKGYVNFADINGDGLTDLIKHSAYGYFYVYFSSGDGNFLDPVESRIIQGSTNAGYVHFAEVNSDGFGDLILRTATGWVYTYLSHGDGTFADPFELTNHGGSANPGFVHFADVRGKRVSDLVTRSATGRVYAHLCNGGPTDLLTRISNGRGATSRITYRLSNDYPDSTLPFVVNTVATLKIDDGNGIQSAFSYDYSGGRYDAIDREFRGFQINIQTNPDQTTIQRWFHQDDFFKGKDYRIKFASPSAALGLVESSWDKVNFSQGAFIHLLHKHREIYDGPTIELDQSYIYDDSNGNLLSSVSSGPGAEGLTILQKYEKYGAWNWRRTQLTVSGAQSGAVREIYYGYEPGTGNLLFRKQWNDRGEYPLTRWTYDGYGNPITETNAMGNTTITEYETVAHAFPSRITRPETNGTSHIEENLAFDYRVGKVTTTRDENGNLTYYAYDSLGRLTRADFPDGGQTAYSYNDSSFPSFIKTTATTGTGAPIITCEYFDGLQRKIQTVTYGENGKPIYTNAFYDNMGRNYRNEGPYFTKSGGYPWKRSVFDYFGRPEKIESPDGEHGIVSTTFSYSGFETTTTDPDLAKKKIVKDYLDRIIQVVEYSDRGEIYTAYNYNAVGDLKTITNHAGVTTVFDYDTLGRMRSMNDPDMGFWQYDFDLNGNLKAQVDHKQQTIEFDFDELDRVTSKTYSTSDSPVSYKYDNPEVPNGIGRLHSVSNSQVTVTYDEYDEMGRQISVSKKIAGDETVFTTHNEYDLAGNLIAMIYPDGYKVDYALHPGTRLIHRVIGPQETEFGAFEDYEPGAKIGYMYQGNGTATTFSYDRESTRLLGIRAQDPSVNPANDITYKSYRFTPAGDIKEITDHLKNVTRYYHYDRLHRLISETSSDVALVHPSRVIRLTYNYEGDGPFHAPKAIEAGGAVHYPAYDQNGNMTVSPNLADPEVVAYREIDYNADNMPSQISLPVESPTGTNCSDGKPGAECTQKVEFLYDGESKRAKKTSSKSIGSTYYIGEHFEIVDGKPIKYIFAGNLRIAKITSSEIQYYHKDHLHSSTAVTNDLGEKIETTEYFPFGYERSHTGTRTSNYQYTDQELDPKSGLYNYGARLYDPVIARFIAPDNLIPDFYNPQTLNRYSYALNNPLLYNDPDGHFAITATIVLGFLAAKALAIGISYVVTRTVVEGIGNPVIPSDFPNQPNSGSNEYHLSDFTNDTFAGLSVLAAGEAATIATGELAAANPALVKNAIEFGIGSAVPGPPPPTVWGIRGFVAGRMALAAKGLYENLNAKRTIQNECTPSHNSIMNEPNRSNKEMQNQNASQTKSDNSNTRKNAIITKQKKIP